MLFSSSRTGRGGADGRSGGRLFGALGCCCCWSHVDIVRVDGSVGDAIAREEDTLLCRRLLHLSMGH